MDYNDKFDAQKRKYDELKQKYEELVLSDTYQRIVTSMPFELLAAKQTMETLELFTKLQTKPKIIFHSVEEAEVLYNNLKNFTVNSKSLLDCAAYIESVDSLIKEINELVDDSPYLSESLKIDNDVYLSGIAKDCLRNLPNGAKLITCDFKYNYIESCLYSLDKDDLQRLVEKKMIKSKEINHISLTGSEKYEDNLKYLCFLTDHKILTEVSFSTKLKGVKFNNEDGTPRQQILKELDTAVKNGEKPKIILKKYVYHPPVGAAEPAVGVYWNDKCLGNLPAPIARDIEDKYVNSELLAEFNQVVGGGELTYGLEITVNVIASEINKSMLETKLENLKKQLESSEKGSFTEAEKAKIRKQIEDTQKELDDLSIEK